jgi:hypothetical protein
MGAAGRSGAISGREYSHGIYSRLILIFKALSERTGCTRKEFFYSLNALMDKVRDYGIERELYSR